MPNTLKHVGVLGMRWGHHKGITKYPVSSDHARAMANRNLFKTSTKDLANSRKRLSLEHAIDRIQKKGRLANPVPAKSMTNAEIESFFKNPIMKKKLREIKRNDEIKKGLAIRAVAATLALGFYMHSIGGDRVIARDVSNLAKAGMIDMINKRKYHPVAADVIDLAWKNSKALTLRR